MTSAASTRLYLRIDRATQHLGVIEAHAAEVARKYDEGPFIGQLEIKNNEYVFGIDEPLPSEWGLDVGEFAVQLLATLDNLIWALVERRGESGNNATGFVIADSEGRWNNARLNSRRHTDVLAGLTAADIAVVQAAQPQAA